MDRFLLIRAISLDSLLESMNNVTTATFAQVHMGEDAESWFCVFDRAPHAVITYGEIQDMQSMNLFNSSCTCGFCLDCLANIRLVESA